MVSKTGDRGNNGKGWAIVWSKSNAGDLKEVAELI